MLNLFAVPGDIFFISDHELYTMQEDKKIVVSEQEFRKRFVYDQSNLLGEGGFAKVFQAFDRQFDETVALKFYTNTDAKKYDIISEMRSSRRFTHKNIIRVHDARIVRFTNSFGLTEDVQVGIIEFANAGNLKDFLDTSPSEKEFKEVIQGILHALHYLHTEKRVIHRDLSPDNVLMMKENGVWTPKIADFGISKQIDLKTINMGKSKVSSELVGKMEYMAPEQFDPKTYGIDQRITTNVDLWSFGVILTEIFTEKTPFGDRNTSQSPMEIMHNVLHHPLPPQINDIPEPYRKIIKACLVKDAKRRVQSSLELIEILNTPIEKKKSLSKLWIVGAALAVMLVALGIWFILLPGDENPEQVKREASMPDEELPDLLPQPSDSSGTAGDEVQKNPPKKKEKAAENTLKLPAETAGLTDAEKLKLFENLLRDIKSLDNETANAQLRMGRIDRFVSTYFTGKQAKVVMGKSKGGQEQNIEEFFKYVVNTAGIEMREWKIDTAQTRLDGKKITTLYIKKF